jgi:hypothetical protein
MFDSLDSEMAEMIVDTGINCGRYPDRFNPVDHFINYTCFPTFWWVGVPGDLDTVFLNHV